MSRIEKSTSPLFNGSVGTNPDFRRYKVNNSQAFRAMYEIMRNDGDFNSPEFDPMVKEMIQTGSFYKNVSNGEKLATKVQQFAAAWKQIKNDAKLRAMVSATISSFHASWSEYPDAISYYTDKEEFPVYFDVQKYLEDLLDADGRVKPNAKDSQGTYTELAIDWRAQINQQYLDSQASRRRGDSEVS